MPGRAFRSDSRMLSLFGVIGSWPRTTLAWRISPVNARPLAPRAEGLLMSETAVQEILERIQQLPDQDRLLLEERLAQPPLFLDRLTPAEQKQLLQLLAKIFETERRRPR